MKTKTEKTKSVQIPFDGFYYSQADHIIENHIDSEIYYFENEHDKKIVLQWDDFSVNRIEFAKSYVDSYEQYVLNEHDIELKLQFDELTSPKFYNYTTDKIFCHVSDEVLSMLHERFIELSNAQDIIDDTFKSRDGFASFYDEFCHEWKDKPLSEWDENELSVLFPTVDDWFEVYETFISDGSLYECVTINKEGI